MAVFYVQAPGDGGPPRPATLPPSSPALPDARVLPVPVPIQFALAVLQTINAHEASTPVRFDDGHIMPMLLSEAEGGCRDQACRVITQYLAGETWLPDAPSAASLEPTPPEAPEAPRVPAVAAQMNDATLQDTYRDACAVYGPQSVAATQLQLELERRARSAPPASEGGAT